MANLIGTAILLAVVAIASMTAVAEARTVAFINDDGLHTNLEAVKGSRAKRREIIIS